MMRILWVCGSKVLGGAEPRYSDSSTDALGGHEIGARSFARLVVRAVTDLSQSSQNRVSFAFSSASSRSRRFVADEVSAD